MRSCCSVVSFLMMQLQNFIKRNMYALLRFDAFYDTFCVSAFVCYSNLQKFYSTCEVRINVTSLCLHNNDKGLVICLYVFQFYE